MLAMMNFRSLDFVDQISPRPILMIVGENAHSKFYSENVYKVASEPKELLSWRWKIKAISVESSPAHDEVAPDPPDKYQYNPNLLSCHKKPGK